MQILQDCEKFARTIFHVKHMHMGKTGLRDHAKAMLLEIADDLETYQSGSEQADKSKGYGADDGEESSAHVHDVDRQTSGLCLQTITSLSPDNQRGAGA